MGKILVFGSYVVDLASRAPHLPAPGETVRGSVFRMGPGGKGFNQAIAAGMAGGDVDVVVKIGRDSFAELAEKYMEDYVPASAACPLADGAIDALEAFKAAGRRQVILSASNLDTLRRQTDERGVTGYFDRLLGLGDIYAKSKVEIGLAYLKENGFDPARAVMIGDSVHDYEVAQALGVRCVLQSGGHQPPEKLRETGAPVVKGLREAAALILE